MASYSDDFNRATLGDDWNVLRGQWDLEANRLSPRFGILLSLVEFVPQLDSKDHSCEIDFVADGGEAFALVGPSVNIKAGEATGYTSFLRQQGSISAIQLLTNGETTTLISTGLGVGPPLTAKLERDGDFLRLYKDGVEVAEYEIVGTPLNHTGVAQRAHGTLPAPAYGDGGYQFDNFFAEDRDHAAGPAVPTGLTVDTLTATSVKWVWS